jgi:3-hydroxyisobutyrate dehydrogenase/glyoxylate/succinic semialdehyde reductase
MVMNQMLGTVMAAFAESLVLGEALGLPRNALFEALLDGPVGAPFLKLKRDRIENGEFEPADFPLRWLQKDLHLAAVSAWESGVAIPLTNAAKDTYGLAIRAGHGTEDFSAIYGFLAERRSGGSHVTGSEPGKEERTDRRK